MIKVTCNVKYLPDLAKYSEHLFDSIEDIIDQEGYKVVEDTKVSMQSEKHGKVYSYGVASARGEPMGVKTGDTLTSLYVDINNPNLGYTAGGSTEQFALWESGIENREAMTPAYLESVKRTQEKLDDIIIPADYESD